MLLSDVLNVVAVIFNTVLLMFVLLHVKTYQISVHCFRPVLLVILQIVSYFHSLAKHAQCSLVKICMLKIGISSLDMAGASGYQGKLWSSPAAWPCSADQTELNQRIIFHSADCILRSVIKMHLAEQKCFRHLNRHLKRASYHPSWHACLVHTFTMSMFRSKVSFTGSKCVSICRY